MLITKNSLGVATFLSLTTLTSARISHSHIKLPDHSLHRRQSIPTTLPGNWTSKGCWTDNVATRTLTGPTFTDTVNMTIENCIAFCDNQNFIFAGVEFSQECYCDNFIENGGALADDQTTCNDACKGNAAELCGGSDRLNLFFSGGTPPPPPSAPAFIGLWESLGCYTDDPAARTLTLRTNTVGDVTIDSCTNACFASGFPLSGVEFSDECYCGLEISNGGVPATDPTTCNMLCQGNSSEICGGSDRLNVYNYTGTDLPPVTTPPPPPGGGGNPAAPVFPVTSGLPGGFEYKGCFVDNAFGRILGNQQADNNNLTVESCVASCTALNMTVVGVEFSVQCFCGTELLDAATIGAETDCDMGCGGNATEACGGPNRMSIYSTIPGNVTILPVPIVQNTSLPGKWQFQGCITDNNDGARVFPNQLILTNNNSATNCLNACATYGYPAAGMEFGDECWCGDVSDITTNNATMAPETDCSFPCSGDAIHLCGGALRLQLYIWDQSDPLVTFHTPEVTGQYELLIGGIVIPLIATVGVNNKVQFLEKFGTSDPPNSTGAYELDLSLTDDFFHAWRELHVQSDVFCSGSLILPDKAGRQLNVGGWSLDSTFGVRLYTPDGSPGVNGTNDWEENNSVLRLQNGRWYPGVMVMANGSVLVVGGESGSNAPPVPTLEILPTPTGGGSTFLFQDWLNRTDPFNLYPFLFVLPHGGVFVIYYNEARILDETTFETTRTLPNLPGSLSDFTAGRTYPMEGTAVLMPQHAPYTDPITVLVCGGATILGEALDNCVSIQPEVQGANWTIERMPSKRVMTCIAALPDGTYMIMNGAQQGHAGFGLAVDPNFQATLYDPTQPIGSRFSILNSTIVARMYHSEAVLMPDGRVLVSGSDPEDPRFPQEFRMEVYTPPYLSNGLKQPNFTITETDWAYGGQYTINVNLFQGTTSTMRVSLMGAVSSTHGNSFGSRTFFPAFSCTGNTCTITAPPNAHVSPPGWFQLFVLDGPTPSHSHWVRIGGDPGSLGNWPDAPGFTLPGV